MTTEHQGAHRGLAEWFAIGHPRYRMWLIKLLVAGTIGSALAYLDNYVLSALTDSLAVSFGDGAAAAGGQSPALAGPFVALASTVGLALPMVVLGVFVLARLINAAVAFWRARVAGALDIASRNDLESEILSHLLRKDDAFFSSHSPAETVNRLAVDIDRVSERRPALMTVWWSVLLMVGSLIFFFQRDWRLAVVALLACGGGAFWTYRITRNVSGYDRDFLEQDDLVKAQFEDYLRAAPEIQIGHLFPQVRRSFVGRQRGRTELYAKYISLTAMLQVANVVSAVGAFASMIGILLWLSHGGGGHEALVLVPAVIWALPSLFQNASELIYLRLDFQLAATSMERLLEYESPIEEELTAADRADDDPQAEPLELEAVTYQYTGSDGTRQGGVQDVSTQFEPGSWTAIVGGAGSGKSTVLKLLLGRFQPQAGTIRYGESSLKALGSERLASRLSLMPQSLALLNATVRDNIRFGRRGGDDHKDDQLSADDLAVVEQVGLGRVCRLKALEMLPGEAPAPQALSQGIKAVRSRVRAALTEGCGVTIEPYESTTADHKHWWLEALVRGKCDRGATIYALLGDKEDARALLPLAEGRLARGLAQHGKAVLRESQNLLRLPSYPLYSQLAPIPLDEGLWQVRSGHLHLVDGDPSSPAEAASLLLIALTSAPIEGAGSADLAAEVDALRKDAAEELQTLEALLGPSWSRFTADEVHSHLSWRENLIFGSMDVPNSRTGRLVDQALIELLEKDNELKDAFTHLGFDVDVGRQGGNLSGGQGQLVALTRTLLRRTPVMVLDEPTSALDPASRTRVCEFLGQWKTDRVLITVSHDPELVRHADEVRLMEGGRLVASGTFDELQEQSDAFRDIMRQP